MENFEIGDLVVLSSGSMRMAVEALDGETVACVWCHEGIIGRDRFNAKLLRKWEHREDDKSSPRGEGRGPGRGGDGARRRPPAGAGEDRAPRGKPGWDGKPREKKFFRKEG